LSPLPPPEGQGLAVASGDRRPDAHVAVAVQEIERAALLDAVEQVDDRRQRGGLAGLVGAVDQRQRRVGAEADPLVREAAEAVDVVFAESHAPYPVSAPVPASGSSRARTRSRAAASRRLTSGPRSSSSSRSRTSFGAFWRIAARSSR